MAYVLTTKDYQEVFKQKQRKTSAIISVILSIVCALAIPLITGKAVTAFIGLALFIPYFFLYCFVMKVKMSNLIKKNPIYTMPKEVCITNGKLTISCNEQNVSIPRSNIKTIDKRNRFIVLNCVDGQRILPQSALTNELNAFLFTNQETTHL